MNIAPPGPEQGRCVSRKGSLDFALVKNPSDPGSPEGKLVLGVREGGRHSRRCEEKEKKAAGEQRGSEENRGGARVRGGAQESEGEVEEVPLPVHPRAGRPACVPSKALSCFCTVDILYD